MKVFKITLFFLLSTMLFASCNMEEEIPALKMDNADREFLEQLSQVIATEIVVGTPKQTVDSILLSCGFQFYGRKYLIENIYAYNAPSSIFPLGLYCYSWSHRYSDIEPVLAEAGIYTMDGDSIYAIIDEQYKESIYTKGRIYADVRPKYDGSQCLESLELSVLIHPRLEEKRYIAKLFSNAIYQNYYDYYDQPEDEGWCDWSAWAFYFHADYDYNLNHSDKTFDIKSYDPSDPSPDRAAYLDFLMDKECFETTEQIYIDTSELHVYCSYSFRFYNYINFHPFFESVAGFRYKYYGRLSDPEY